MIKLSQIILQLVGLLLLSTSGVVAQTTNTPSEKEADTQELQKFYDVEVVIFKFNTPINNGEINLPTPTAIRTEETIDFTTPENIEKASILKFSPLLPEEYQLQQSAQRIKNSSRYTLLSHIGWRQPGLEETDSIPVWITGGKIYGKGYSSIDQVTTGNKSLSDDSLKSDPNANNQDKPQNEVVSGEAKDTAQKKIVAYPKIRENEFHELDGLITIILSRYLHTKADLVFRKPADVTNIMMNEENRILADLDKVEGQLLLNYGLNEKRRMRSKRLHYLDNPQFGMLVIITPYEAPIEAQQMEAGNSIATPLPVDIPGIIAQ